MRQQWNDKRLNFKHRLKGHLKGKDRVGWHGVSLTDLIAEKIKYLTLTDVSKVWMPDTFFRNEKIGQFHNILTPNLYIRVYPDGDVLYSIRISLTCFCSMYLALFPLDEQTCVLDIASCEFKLICSVKMLLVAKVTLEITLGSHNHQSQDILACFSNLCWMRITLSSQYCWVDLSTE